MKPNELKVTVSKEEAARLNGSLTIGIINPIMKIYQYAAFLSIIDCNDKKWAQMEGLSAVWNAGRIQGIREERAKRKSKFAAGCEFKNRGESK